MGRKLPEIEVTFINNFTPEETMERLDRMYDILFDSMVADGYVLSKNGLLVKPAKDDSPATLN